MKDVQCVEVQEEIDVLPVLELDMKCVTFAMERDVKNANLATDQATTIPEEIAFHAGVVAIKIAVIVSDKDMKIVADAADVVIQNVFTAMEKEFIIALSAITLGKNNVKDVKALVN